MEKSKSNQNKSNEIQKVKILYIAGWGRSGSTIIGNVLGQLPGFYSVGETRYIWRFGLIENRKCGCDKEFNNCETWGNILDLTFGDRKKINVYELEELCYKETRNLNTIRSLLGFRTGWISNRLRKWLEILEQLFLSISKYSENSVIVETSKSPLYAIALLQIPRIDLHIVHLVRDPRAVAHSWSKPKGVLDIHSPPFTSIMWLFWNLLLEKIRATNPDKYICVRYEDFSERPLQLVDRLINFLGVKVKNLPFLDDHRVVLKQTHTVAGNPNRFEAGVVQINPDTRWKNSMKWTDKFIVTFLTWPLLLKYHYQIFQVGSKNHNKLNIENR